MNESIRSYLTESTTAQLVSSFITSRLDYCNATLAGVPAIPTESKRMQPGYSSEEIQKRSCSTPAPALTLATHSRMN